MARRASGEARGGPIGGCEPPGAGVILRGLLASRNMLPRKKVTLLHGWVGVLGNAAFPIPRIGVSAPRL